MSFPRYERYKDSGVEWLGEVPEHWEVKRLKAALSEPLMYGANEAADDDNPENPRFVRITDITDNGFLRNETFRSLPQHIAGAYLLLEGDVLLARSGATVGKTFVYRKNWGECCFAGYLIRARLDPHKMLASFFYACCQADFYWNFINIIQIQATIQNVSAERYANFFLPYPPIQEQKLIAIFLDRETAKIDALIAEQQRLIELLKEKRQAVISHAVTKGLNPDAPMKDSGIEWLGEVPEHWEVGPLKNFAEIIDCKHYTVEFLDEGLPVVSIREVRNDKIDLSNAKLTTKKDWEFLREGRVPQQGDMIFCRNASVGAVGYVDGEAAFCMGQDVCLIRPEIATRFIHYQLTSPLIRNQIEAFLVGATIRRANVEEIRNLIVVHPTKDDQRDIAAFLNREIAKLDALTAEAQTAISLLQERRTALISAAVTGKIDVRGFFQTTQV